MNNCKYACGTADHTVSRRSFLGATAAGVTGLLGGFTAAASARDLAKAGKRVLTIFLSGGVSQLETWDPKPNTDTGGPFQAIPTSVPGTHICELLPHTAKQMHRMALVRGVNTAEDDHGEGRSSCTPAGEPSRGSSTRISAPSRPSCSAPARKNCPATSRFTRVAGAGSTAGRRVPRAALRLGRRRRWQAAGQPLSPAGLTADADRQREDMRQKLNEPLRASPGARPMTEAYTESYDQAAKVMARGDVFDVAKEDPKLRRQVWPARLRPALPARPPPARSRASRSSRCTHSNYDTHHENFDFHIEQLGEFDQPFATLLDDLADRGMLESTLVIVMSEFGRTPTINHLYGRDHWSKAWSVAMAGCGIKAGAMVGKTNANGTAVTDREVNGGHLFHTYLRALGPDPTKNFYPNDRPIPMADPKASAITEILA